MTDLQQAYVDGWIAVMDGADPRYQSPYKGAWKTREDPTGELQSAWTHGALDAMEAEDGETPQPETVGL